ncbi:TetR/AcrR family transcriptional regulator [Rhizobium sp. L1K21]|uniref:TetR/AcrR family transcriptional regulator n=1 Tax=Rhizobium sp. L1K21 TaxID=2954933 RepID=UPI0020920D0B|nr:TetR/AcrR family transcriptional regulator [Rhizobium sp. L1K21]MCO6186455.1 TetR/AcrR family transcriptional regulator [Rhizobium sp. L1K21]
MLDTVTNPIPLTRDRSATERRIFEAARSLLAEAGFQGFGVNAIARRAGCDKQLIYRYYGGMDGLIDAIGEDLSSWVEAHVPDDPGGRFILTYGDLIERLLELYMRALREDHLMRRVIAWEISESTPQVRRVAEARARGLSAWIEKMRGSLTPPKGVDAIATNAALMGAAQQIVLSAIMNGFACGIPVKTEKDWAKLEAAVCRLAHNAYI